MISSLFTSLKMLLCFVLETVAAIGAFMSFMEGRWQQATFWMLVAIFFTLNGWFTSLESHERGM